ncbi:MAG TPA: FmdB family zinc ribbon protein [Candidatus Acidoferrales bacterium]|nr:FmdB family zinc ribbon protein [Candidatus Acidoferrales bacterium]
MPLYEYECPRCHTRFEKIEKTGARQTRTCIKCGARAKRLLSAPAIQFKGAGWYVTDYAGKGRSEPKAEKTEASEKADKEKKDSKVQKPEKQEKAPAKAKDKTGSSSAG